GGLHHPHGDIEEAVGDEATEIVPAPATQLVEAQYGIDAPAQVRLAECAARADVDAPAHAVARHVRHHGSAHDNRAGDRRRDRIEAGGAAGGADHVDAVESDRGPAGASAAQADEAFLSLVALHGDAGQARNGSGDVLVGEAA